MNWVSLHNHTSGSTLDGACDIVKLVSRAKELNMPALAITDHGNMIKTLEFQEECIKQGIKPIIGCEFYIGEPDSTDTYHILCLAKNNVGLKNLYKLNTYSYIENFYKKPRISISKLLEHKEGLIVTTACLGSELARNYSGKMPDITYINYIKPLHSAFGDDFYLEIQPNTISEQTDYNHFIVQMSNMFDIPVVATCDVHYVRKEDAKAHDVLLAMQVKKKVTDPDRFRFSSEDYYLKSREEMIGQLLSMGLNTYNVNQSIINTVTIADKCNALIETGLHLLPRFENMTKGEEINELALHCNKGYQERYKEFDKVKVERVAYELSVIKEKGYAGYFLIVEDFINYAKEKGIYVGPGRGSAAGSVVAYLLGITNIDPFEYGLLFERFLNPDRDSPPDIDSDFDYERRDEIVAYVKEKYGLDKVANIIAEGTLAPRAVIRKVMSAYDFEQRYINQVCKTVSDASFDTVQEAYDTVPDFKRHIDSNVGLDKLEVMKTLEGLMSYVGKHAAGIVISSKPVDDYVPCMRDSDSGDLMTQWHKKLLEKVGVYKFDFLGLKTLTVLRKTVEQIKRNHNIDIDLNSINLDDPGVYSVLNSLDLCGIFQYDAPAGKQTVARIKPKIFNDIIAAEALCRPGVREAELYFEDKQDIVYESAIVEEILAPTRGAIVYQEQTMLLMNKLAGWSLGKADSMRKVKNLEDYREEFVRDCVTRNYSETFANRIYDRFDLGYSFNKSHAAAYAVISATCAWLKCYYRAEFMAATMTLEVKGNSDKLMEQIKEAGKYNINMLLPDVRVSRFDFVPTSEGILLPLTSIASVGDKAVDAISSMFNNNQSYTSLEEFLDNAPKQALNKRVMEKLIKGGAFDFFNSNRSILLSQYFSYRGEPYQGMTWSKEVQAVFEKETIGMTLSSHPLDGYSIPPFSSFPEGQMTTLGIVADIKQILDKNNNEMAFIKVENKSDIIDCVVFNRAYSIYKNTLYNGAIVRIQGKKDKNSLLVNEIQGVS